MTKPYVLVAGPNLSTDSKLLKHLSDEVVLLQTPDYSEIIGMLEKWQVDLLLLEVSDAEMVDFSLIGKAKQTIPGLLIIVINGDNIAGAFARGATDAFPKPYDPALLVERVLALLRRMPEVGACIRYHKRKS